MSSMCSQTQRGLASIQPVELRVGHAAFPGAPLQYFCHRSLQSQGACTVSEVPPPEVLQVEPAHGLGCFGRRTPRRKFHGAKNRSPQETRNIYGHSALATRYSLSLM